MVESTNPPQPRPVWKRYGLEFLLVWRLGIARLLSRWWVILFIVGLGILCVLGNGGWDDRVLNGIRAPDNSKLTDAARFLSYWGDVRWAVILALLLLGLGVVCGCPRWRQICHACLIATAVSGMAVNVFRAPLGRARPYANLPDGFYGPHLKAAYHGFPSGHATSAFASAAAVAAAAPLIGVPCLIFAGGVSWSRLQLNHHHPVDVLTGAALGTLIGLCFGSAVDGAKFRLRRKRRTPRR